MKSARIYSAEYVTFADLAKLPPQVASVQLIFYGGSVWVGRVSATDDPRIHRRTKPTTKFTEPMPFIISFLWISLPIR